MNQIPTNPWHFPPGILLITLFFICILGESEPICHETAALSPGNIAHNAIFICIFGESEPIYHETVALSPGTKAVRQIYQKILLTPPPKYPPSIFPVHFITRNVAQVTVTNSQRWQTTREKICKNVEFVETKNKNRTRFGVCPHTTRKQVLFYYNKESIPLAPSYRPLSISHQTAVHSASRIKHLPLGILPPAEVQSLPVQSPPSPVTAITASTVIAKFSLCPRPCLRQKLCWQQKFCCRQRPCRLLQT